MRFPIRPLTLPSAIIDLLTSTTLLRLFNCLTNPASFLIPSHLRRRLGETCHLLLCNRISEDFQSLLSRFLDGGNREERRQRTSRNIWCQSLPCFYCQKFRPDFPHSTGAEHAIADHRNSVLILAGLLVLPVSASLHHGWYSILPSLHQGGINLMNLNGSSSTKDWLVGMKLDKFGCSLKHVSFCDETVRCRVQVNPREIEIELRDSTVERDTANIGDSACDSRCERFEEVGQRFLELLQHAPRMSDCAFTI